MYSEAATSPIQNTGMSKVKDWICFLRSEASGSSQESYGERALNELRKVTNNLIRTYGKPDRIRVELARELKLPGARRRDYQTESKNRNPKGIKQELI